MAQVLRYTRSDELEPVAITWYEPDGSLYDFSSGWTFRARIGNGSGFLVEKTSGFTGAATAPNLQLDFTAGELDGVASGTYHLDVQATLGVTSQSITRTWMFQVLAGVGTDTLPQSPTSLGVLGDLSVGGDITLGGDLIGFPELVAGDPAEIDFDTAGNVTTLTVLDTIARALFPAAPNEYINQQTHTAWATATLVQDAVYYMPYALAKGTLDRLSVEVTTAQAASTLRMGVYARNGLRPGNRLAESSSGAVSSATLGAKEFTFALAVPVNGFYYVALVAQGAAGVQVRSPNSTTIFPLPLGATAPSGTTTWGSLAETGVTGALPATAGTTAIDSNDYRCNARYSAVG